MAPIAYIAGGALASTVASAGALGVIGGGYGDADWIRAQHGLAAGHDVGVGLITSRLAEQPDLVSRLISDGVRIFVCRSAIRRHTHRRSCVRERGSVVPPNVSAQIFPPVGVENRRSPGRECGRPRCRATRRPCLRTCVVLLAWRRRAWSRSRTMIDVHVRADRTARVSSVVDVVALIDQFGDRSQGVGVRDAQVLGLHRVGPSFERCCLFGAGPGHGIHQPCRNFDRAAMAWITAAPSSSVTTPISSGSPLLDGPMNIVTAGLSVSKALQCGSLSSSVTPCLRALASMSTWEPGYDITRSSSTHVDDWAGRGEGSRPSSGPHARPPAARRRQSSW